MPLENTQEVDRVFTLRLRPSLRRCLQFNNMQSATRNLPYEILAHIFLYLSPPIDIIPSNISLGPKEAHLDDHAQESYLPIHLGTVCSQWFYATQSTPQLWSSLILNVEKGRVASKVSVLQTYLENSQNVPFCLELNINKNNLPQTRSKNNRAASPSATNDRQEIALLRHLHTIIFTCPENTRRFRVLRINELPPTWTRFSFKDFPLLEELYFGTSKENDRTPRIEGFTTPRLNRIIFKNWSFSLNIAPHQDKSLTVVNLIGVRTADCLRMLKLFPNLVEFRARDSHLDGSWSSANHIVDKEFTMPRLEIFEWALGRDRPTKEMLQYVRLPMLRDLSFEAHSWVFPGVLEGFFGRLPKSLVELGVVCRTFDPQQFWHIPTNVSKLSLWRCCPECIAYVLISLADPRLLPSLEEICLIEPQCDPDMKEPVMMTQLLNMIVSRYRVLDGNRLRFRMIGYPISRSENDGIRDAKIFQKGFELEVYQDERLLDLSYTRSTWWAFTIRI